MGAGFERVVEDAVVTMRTDVSSTTQPAAKPDVIPEITSTQAGGSENCAVVASGATVEAVVALSELRKAFAENRPPNLRRLNVNAWVAHNASLPPEEIRSYLTSGERIHVPSEKVFQGMLKLNPGSKVRWCSPDLYTPAQMRENGMCLIGHIEIHEGFKAKVDAGVRFFPLARLAM
jgi:hypothetical protein